MLIGKLWLTRCYCYLIVNLQCIRISISIFFSRLRILFLSTSNFVFVDFNYCFVSISNIVFVGFEYFSRFRNFVISITFRILDLVFAHVDSFIPFGITFVFWTSYFNDVDILSATKRHRIQCHATLNANPSGVLTVLG